MSAPTDDRAYRILWWALGFGLLYLGGATAVNAFGAGAAHDAGRPHALVVGGSEAIAAVLFLIPRTLIIGGVGLLASIGVAFVTHAAAGQFAVPLLMYAAAVWFIMVTGKGRSLPSSPVR